MKIVETVVLLRRGDFAQSNEWAAIRDTVHSAIARAEWPIGAGNFIIHPQSGKKSGEGNGVVPIKAKPMAVRRLGAGISLGGGNEDRSHGARQRFEAR